MAKKVIIDPIRMGYYTQDMDEIEQSFFNQLTPQEKDILTISTAFELQDIIANHHFTSIEKDRD